MPTEIIGLYAAGDGDTDDAAAQVDIPADGVITGIDWDVNGVLDGNETLEAELSFIATNQLAQNDVRGRISSVGMQGNLNTNGFSNVGLQKHVGPVDLAVAGGERLYLHVMGSSGVTSRVRCNVHLDVSGRGLTRRSARRR